MTKDTAKDIEARLQEINNKIDSWMGQPDSNESRDKQKAILLLDEARDVMDAALIQLTTLTDNRDSWALLAEQAQRSINELQTQLTASAEELARAKYDIGVLGQLLYDSEQQLRASAAQEARLRAALEGLSRDVMNIPAAVVDNVHDGEAQAYRRGHRDARHAACELIATLQPLGETSR